MYEWLNYIKEVSLMMFLGVIIKYLFDGDKLADVKYYSINGNADRIEEFKELYLSWI